MNNMQLNKIINDEDYVSVINNISKSIYNYYKATKGNCNIISNNYNLLNDKFKNISEIKNIMSIHLANNENLENFIADMKISFQRLKSIRKQYLNKISNNINNLFIQIKTNSKAFNNNFNFNNYHNIGKNKYDKIINLLLSLDKFSEILENYSDEKTDEFRRILSLIKKELDNNKNYINNNQDISLNKEINKLKNELNEMQKNRNELDKRYKELFGIYKMNEKKLGDKDTEITSLNEDLKSINFTFNKVNNDNIQKDDIINKLTKEIDLINNEKKSVNDEYNIIKDELENKNKEIKQLEEKIKEAQEEQKSKNNDIMLQNEEQNNKIEKLELENKNLIEEKKRELEKQKEAYELKIEEYNKKINKHKEEKNNYENEKKEKDNIIKEEKEKNKKFKEEYNDNIIKLKEIKEKNENQIIQIDKLNKIIIEKDKLIEDYRNNYNADKEEQINKYKNDIKVLEEQNKNLIEKNKELKQSNTDILKSINPDILKISKSLNEYMEKKSLNIETFDENTIKDYFDNNLLVEEEYKKLKEENENLKNKIKEMEKQNSINSENIIATKAKKVIAQSVNSADSEEEENDVNYLAMKARRKNNSEDMKIDFPGLSNINDKYEKLKSALKEIKEIFNEIKLNIQIDESSVKFKLNRISELLNIDIN